MTFKKREKETVALFVNCGFNYKAVEEMSVVVDNDWKCVTIKNLMEKKKNVKASCMNRIPGCSRETFKSCMEENLTQKLFFAHFIGLLGFLMMDDDDFNSIFCSMCAFVMCFLSITHFLSHFTEHGLISY